MVLERLASRKSSQGLEVGEMSRGRGLATFVILTESTTSTLQCTISPKIHIYEVQLKTVQQFFYGLVVKKASLLSAYAFALGL